MAVILPSGAAGNPADENADFDNRHAWIAYRYAAGSATATTENVEFPAAHANNPFTYQGWMPTALPATWNFTASASAAVDYFYIAAHDLATAGASVLVEYDSGGGIWNSLANVTPTDNSPIFAYFGEVTATMFRVTVSGSTLPVLGVIRFGKMMQMARPIYQNVAPMSLNDSVVFKDTESETGHWLGRSIYRRFAQGAFEWSNCPQAWVESYFKPFRQAAHTEPFCFAFNPLRFPNDVAYVKAIAPPESRTTGPRDLMAVSMNLRGYQNV